MLPVLQSEQMPEMHLIFFNVGPASIRLTLIETAMGFDADPTFHRYRVGRNTFCVPGTYIDACTDLSALAVE